MTSQNAIHILSRALIIDQDHILLCKTLDLPVPFYFLPGGHIEHGESAETAVLRELMEESGFEGKIKRFLGCFENSFEPGHSSICHNHEYNLIFEVVLEGLKFPTPIPQREAHIELVWIPLASLNTLDVRPQLLGTCLLGWLALSSNDAFQSTMV